MKLCHNNGLAYINTACTPYKALKAGTTTWMDTKKIFEIHDIYVVK